MQEEIEEKKIPEKLNLDIDELKGKETPRAIDYLIESKINQVIDYLKSKVEEIDDSKTKLETDIKMQQSYLDYYRTMTRGDKE